MKSLRFLLLMIMSVILFSCSNNEIEKVEFFPFQESEKGLWGMMTPSGEILFTEEFKEKPTVARNGRFMVRNLDGLWEIYTAEEKPQKIGKEYAFASMFQNGKALVAEKNKSVSIIDVDGNILQNLDKIDGKVVDEVSRFSEGFAIYKTEKRYGVIDLNGKAIIKPDYCFINACSDGKFIAVNKKYEKEIRNDSTDNLKYDVLNTSGKVILSLSKSKYKEIGSHFRDGLLDVYIKSKDEKCGGIINEKGDVIVKPTAKIKKVGEIRDKYFTYNNGDGWGLMDTDGISVVRAKYDELFFASDDILVAVTKKDNGSTIYKFIDKEDNQIGEDTYDLAYSFDALDGNYAFVKVSDKLFSLVNKKGEQVEKLPDMVDVRLSEGDYVVESDYIDLKVLLDKANFDQDGIDSLTFKTKPIEFAKFYSKKDECWYGTKEHSAVDPYWYDTKSNYHYTKSINNVNVIVAANFTGNLSKQTYKTQRIIDYEIGDYYWYHDNKIPTGYIFNNVKINIFNLYFSNSGKLRGKLYNLYLALSERFKNMGKVEKENNRAVVVTLKNNLRAIVSMSEDNVMATWGDLKSASEIDISKYKDVKEKPIRVKDYDYFEDRLSRLSIDADTVAVDTVAIN